ncbi:hypothetical protein AMS68_003542 [Peltaster fructicola]|uniref:Uncharacterized protein n=1 Tax=Peltaster fructicola TaxID=286661 RepID=A0A6H0XTQ7_9PEZI|nr:hypothetical protein AMS68_003542 [Peltaster fructicola]
MGVVISTNSTLAPISFASSIIGFVSFAFTLGTFLKVVWVNLETVSEPAHDVHTMLNNLREELLEERASLKVLKKVNKHRRKFRRKLPESLHELLNVELDEVTVKTMSDTVRAYCRQFQQLERPFLKNGEDGIQQARHRRRGDLSPSPHYEHSAYASPPYEKRAKNRDRGRSRNEDSDDDLYWAQRVKYAPYGLRRRLDWLYHKSNAQALMEQLSRLQTRRISRQVNSMAVMLREYGDSVLHSEDQLGRLEERLNRVVGIRRME